MQSYNVSNTEHEEKRMNGYRSIRRRDGQIDYYSILICCIIIVLFCSDVFEKVLPPVVNYADEVLGIFCLVGIFVYLMMQRWSMARSLFAMSVCLVVLLFVGLLGNVFSSLQPWKIVWEDAFLFFKSYFVLLFFLMSLTAKQAQQIVRVARVLSEILLIMLFGMALLSRLNAFSSWCNVEGAFVLQAKYYGSISVWAILFFSVIYTGGGIKRLPFYLMTIVVVLLNSSGLGALMLVMIAIAFLLVERSLKFHWYYIPIIVAVGVLAGWNEIKDYLLNTDAPRYLLFFYSFVTMRRYFPLGSGFATYGSAMAARNYSPLYYQYVFSNRYLMSPDNRGALQDSYYPVIFAQFGLVGTLVFIVFIWILVRFFVFPIACRRNKSAALMVLSCLLIAGLGFQAPNLWGCSSFMLFAIYCKLPDPNARPLLGTEGEIETNCP